MKSITLSFLSLLHLTLSAPPPAPAPRSATSLAPPGIAGSDTGVSITMYTKRACDKSSLVQTVELQYNNPIAQPFHSYKLNGTFSADQEVAIYAPASWKATGSNGDDAAAGGNVAVGCEQFVYNLADNMVTEGCHSFDTMMGCVEVQVT